jgi:uncharacterized RDD family membrane protein YckC
MSEEAVTNAQAGMSEDDLAQLAAAASERRGVGGKAFHVDFAGRLAPFLIDSFVQSFGLPLVAMALLFVGESLGWSLVAGLLLIPLFFMWIAYGATEIWAGQTPGKMLLDMRVRRRDGSRSSRGRLAARWAIRRSPELLLALLLLPLSVASSTYDPLLERAAELVRYAAATTALLVFLGCLMAAVNNGIALHDLLTGTAVFREIDVLRNIAGGNQPPGRAFEVRSAQAQADAVWNGQA